MQTDKCSVHLLNKKLWYYSLTMFTQQEREKGNLFKLYLIKQMSKYKYYDDIRY